MSVSSRSPTTSGVRAPVRRTHSACMAGSGLPVISGACPVTALTTPTIAPLPGSGPRGEGMVASALVATCRAPLRTATTASASCAQPTSRP